MLSGSKGGKNHRRKSEKSESSENKLEEFSVDPSTSASSVMMRTPSLSPSIRFMLLMPSFMDVFWFQENIVAASPSRA